jgi:hypothetical protein
MALDISKLKSRLSSLTNQGNKTNLIWKPKPGKQVVRIVPYKYQTDNPFIELKFHYNINNKTYLSPDSFNRPDPIVEFAEKLKQTGDKEDWVMGRKLEPKMRVYAPVIIRGQENEGVKFWGFGKQVYEELLAFFVDPDYGDLSDPKSGRDIVVTVKSPEEAGKTYAETTIRVKPKETPITESQDVLEKIKTQPQITELFPEPSYDDLKIQLQTWMGTSSQEEPAADLNYKQEKSEKPTSSADDIGVTFDDLF